MRYSIFLLIAICGVSGVYAQQDVFEQANELFYRSEYKKACALFDQLAITAGELPRVAAVNYAETVLALGEYKRGFTLFEKRLRNRAPLHKPWDGSDPRGKTILVRAEHGNGDTFFFARYIKLLKDLGVRTILLAQRPLKTIMSYAPYIDTVINANDPVPAYDYDVYLMSLPHYCSAHGLEPTTINTIPQWGQCISAPEQKIQKWRTRLADDHNYKVGICWRASQNKAGEERFLQRDVPLNMLVQALGSIPGVSLYNLQGGQHKQITRSQYDQLRAQGNLNGLDELDVVEDNGPQLKVYDDFDVDAPFVDTAALMESLDVVVSVDTSVGCLAGAMNKTLLLLLPYESDWRWGSERSNTSRWYRTARLFWQRKQGDWVPVVNEVEKWVEHMQEEASLHAILKDMIDYESE